MHTLSAIRYNLTSEPSINAAAWLAREHRVSLTACMLKFLTILSAMVVNHTPRELHTVVLPKGREDGGIYFLANYE
jgi:hypothetical protein